MKFIKSLLVSGAFLLLLGGTAAAQQAPQSSQSLQEQANSAQSTGSVQDNTSSQIQQNQSGTALTQNQPESLGVVGSPNQSEPSVKVGPAATTAAQNDAKKQRPNLLLLLIVAAIAIGLTIYFTTGSSAATPVEPEVKPVKPKHPGAIKKAAADGKPAAKAKKKAASTTPETSTSSKTKPAKKKKKKKAHR